MVSLLDAIILSFIQGITEWFPISSSGHLALAQQYLGFQNLGFDVYLHFASVLAVVILFGKDIAKLTFLTKANKKYLLRILLAIIPVGIVGLLYREHIRYAFSNLLFMGIFFIIFGIFIYSTKFSSEQKHKPSIADSLIIGFAQTLSLFPGISRSGMTVGSGLILGIKKEEAIKFSFLLAVPIILGATLVEAKEIALSNIPPTTLLTAFTITLLTSLVTIKLLIKIINSDKFHLFGIYNVVLGIIVLILNFVN
jgi:undecaprenyl-diphosphatase